MPPVVCLRLFAFRLRQPLVTMSTIMNLSSPFFQAKTFNPAAPSKYLFFDLIRYSHDPSHLLSNASLAQARGHQVSRNTAESGVELFQPPASGWTKSEIYPNYITWFASYP